MKKRSFTLLEIVIGIAVLAIAAGAIGWNLHRLIQKKRFLVNAEKLRSRFFACRQLALNTQADWKCSLEWDGKEWKIDSRSEESPQTPPLTPIRLDSLAMLLDGEKKEALAFAFTSSGEILPKGILKLKENKGAGEIEWKIPDLFFLEEGKGLGPVHPSEVKKRAAKSYTERN